MKSKKYYIETYGCQMNEYDSLIARKILENENCTNVDSPEQADLILINTCAVRENAHTKILHRLDSLSHLHEQNKTIVVLGCLAQKESESLLSHGAVDFIFGPDSFRFLPEIFNQKKSQEKNNSDEIVDKKSFLILSKQETYEDLIPSAKHHLSIDNNGITAYVSIQRGCDNFCSFCVVPFTRGRERSKSPQIIIEEINQLVQKNVKAIILLGQNVNSYRYQEIDFTALIELVLKNTKIELLLFTSPHPKDFPMRLLQLIANEKRLANYLHIPLQAGSDKILKAMRRDYSSQEFLSLIEFARKTIPDVMISTDIIVGFPQETEEDFQATLDVMQVADFDAAFMFAYSERGGTSAQKNLDDNIEKEVKQRRLQEVIRKQLKRSGQHLFSYVDKKVEVLAESFSRRNAKEIVGKMRNSRKVVFSLPENFSDKERQEILGTWVRVQIKSCTTATLLGEWQG